MDTEDESLNTDDILSLVASLTVRGDDIRDMLSNTFLGDWISNSESEADDWLKTASSAPL